MTRIPWRRLLKSRDFHAAWIGAVLLILAIWFDKVWVWGVAVMLVAAALWFIQWLISTWKRPSDDEYL